jgi:hypothetical protein
MKYLNIKNEKSRQDVKKFERNKFILKTILKNTNLFYLTRLESPFKIKGPNKN